MKPLEITCPTCGYVGPCDGGTKVWPGQKELPIELAPLMIGKVGHHVAYRVRSRRCDSTKCNQAFDTIEITKEAFDVLIKELNVTKKHLRRIEAVTAPIFEKTRKFREAFLKKKQSKPPK